MLVQKDSSFVDSKQELVNYAVAFELDCRGNFQDAQVNENLDDTLSSDKLP